VEVHSVWSLKIGVNKKSTGCREVEAAPGGTRG
jgi:hypothetical protein